MQTKIVELRSILKKGGLTSGYSFRGKIHNIHNGGVRIIQLKDFINEYTAIGEECFLIAAENIKPKYFLENGNILFTAKGTNNFALVFEQLGDTPTIASSALFVIKVDEEIANPHYIAWYINQNTVQNYFRTNEAGTYVTSINKSTIEGIPIALPSLALQKQIAQVARLHKKEKSILTEVTALKDSLITNQLLNKL